MKNTWTIGGMLMTVALAAGAHAQSQTPAGNPSTAITVTGCLQQSGAMSGPVGTSGSATPGATAGVPAQANPSGAASASASGGSYVLMNARAGMATANAPGEVTSRAAGSPGSPSGAAAPGSPSSAGSPGAPPTTGTATSSTTTSSAATSPHSVAPPTHSMYILNGEDAQLKQHIGHQVEISGKLAAMGGTQPSVPGVTTTQGTAASPGTTAVTGASGTSTAAPGSPAASAPTGATPGSTNSANAAAMNAPRVDVQSVKMIASNCSTAR